MKRYCYRFPNILQKAFMDGKISIPKNIDYIYGAIEAYRAIDVDDNKQGIIQSDFESRAEKAIRENKFKSLPKGLTS